MKYLTRDLWIQVCSHLERDQLKKIRELNKWWCELYKTDKLWRCIAQRDCPMLLKIRPGDGSILEYVEHIWNYPDLLCKNNLKRYPISIQEFKPDTCSAIEYIELVERYRPIFMTLVSALGSPTLYEDCESIHKHCVSGQEDDISLIYGNVELANYLIGEKDNWIELIDYLADDRIGRWSRYKKRMLKGVALNPGWCQNIERDMKALRAKTIYYSPLMRMFGGEDVDYMKRAMYFLSKFNLKLTQSEIDDVLIYPRLDDDNEDEFRINVLFCLLDCGIYPSQDAIDKFFTFILEKRLHITYLRDENALQKDLFYHLFDHNLYPNMDIITNDVIEDIYDNVEFLASLKFVRAMILGGFKLESAKIVRHIITAYLDIPQCQRSIFLFCKKN